MVAIFVVLGVMVAAALVVVPALLEHQQALADKGGIPNEHASDKASGRHPHI